MAGVAEAVVITAGSASGAPGAQVSIDVTMASEGAAVLATQNRIDFTREAYIAAGDGGSPDCAVNPAIDKNATAFRFLPLGCDPAVDCASVRVFVLAFDNLTPIADGARLYTCAVRIAPDAPAGAYPLALAELGASAAGGVLLATTGVDGLVTSVPPPAARVVVGSAAGEPGDTVQVAVTLSLIDQAAAIAGVQADFAFDPATPVPPTQSGQPDCTFNEEISQAVQSFSFLPHGCTPGSDCTGVHALALSLDTLTPFPDGALLYTCAVAIAGDATAGVYPLVAGEVLGSDPDGAPVPLTGSDGAITVDAPPPPPACAGDCDGSGEVSINELLLGVNILIGSTPLAQCAAMDTNDDGSVAINELIQAVNVALGSCPA
jgi:hypothetical protein